MTATAERVLNYLLVEDNNDHAELIERCFRYGNLPCEIRRVRSGAECLSYLAGDEPFANRTEHPYPDVVLMDIRMPGVLDGLHTLQAIRSDPRHRRLSVMMLTSSDRNSDVSRAYELGASGYVVKSSDTDEMIETLRQVQKSYSSLHRLPERNAEPEPEAQQPGEAEPAASMDLAALLEADQDSAFRSLVSTYRTDPDEMFRMLKVLEQASTTRFTGLASKFCMEQRQLFAGGKAVDWPFIQKVVMEKLPQYEDPERMAGIVAMISAELEGNEWVNGNDPACQAWRGFSTAYLRQRWQTSPSPRQPTAKESPRNSRIWTVLAIAAVLATAAAIAAYAVFVRHRPSDSEDLNKAFLYRDVASRMVYGP